MVLLSISLCAAGADAQQCPPRPSDFVPHVQLHPGDTLIEGERFSFTVLLMPEHCWTARGVRIPARDHELRAVAVDGPSRGQTLAIRQRGERFELTIPAAGTHTLRIESAAHPELRAATVRVHRVDLRSAPRVRLQLERTSVGHVRPPPPAITIVGPAQTQRWILGAHVARGRTTPPIPLDPGTYTIIASAPFEQRATITVGAREPSPVPVRFHGASLTLRTDYEPTHDRHVRVAVRTEDGAVHRVALAFPRTLVSLDLPPGRAQLSVEWTPNVESFADANRRDDWTVLHAESIELAPRSAQSPFWSLAGLLAGQGIAPRPWHERATFEGVARSTPTGDLGQQWRGFEVIGDSLVILGEQLAQRQGAQWSALSMPTGWLAQTGDARFAARSAQSFAWIEQSMNVRYRSAAGITGETIDLSLWIGPDSRCSLTGIAARGADELIAVGRCASSLHPAEVYLERGFVATRDRAGWTVVREQFSSLNDVVTVGDRAIAVGGDGAIVTMQGAEIQRSRHGGEAFSRIRAGTTRVAVQGREGTLYELDPRTRQLRALSYAVEQPSDARPASRFCFVGDALVVLVRQPREGVTRLFLEDRRGFAPIATRPFNAVDLACARDAAWVITENAEHDHSVERVTLSPAR